MDVILNGKKFSIEELKSVSIDETYSDFEKSTLIFCKAWLNHQQEFYIHTSGSTGNPKEIILTRASMEASAKMSIRALQLKPRGTSLIGLHTKYIAGQMMIVRSLLNEMKIILVEPSANPIEKIEEPIDFTALVPYQLENILDHSPHQLNMIKCAIVGGAPVGNALKEKIKNSPCAIYATYGMTETISHIALQKLNGQDAQEYFEALENITLRLDERGCLCITSNYLKNEIVTNDLVDLWDEKKFKWLGRMDNVINSGGIKIIPEKIESVFEKVLHTLSIKKRFFIVGLDDERWGKIVTAFFEGLLSEKEKNEIIEMASMYLNQYELPKKFYSKTKFIETETGKINRTATVAERNN